MTKRTVNPFAKTQFGCHRDWEESLVKFLSKEAKNPDIGNWLHLCTQKDVKEAVVFSALLLSDLLETKPGFRESSEKMYEIYQTIGHADEGANKFAGERANRFEGWLRSGWLNVSRIACMIDAELKH